MHFLKSLVGMLSGMLGLENSNPGRKLQFVVLDLHVFVLKRVLDRMPPAFPQESWLR